MSNEDYVLSGEHLDEGYPDYSPEGHDLLEVDNGDKILDEFDLLKDDIFSSYEDLQQEQEMMKEELLTMMDSGDDDVYEEILVSINDSLSNTNNYLYTINIYMSGFLIIIILYLLTKSLIGFFRPFIR